MLNTRLNYTSRAYCTDYPEKNGEVLVFVHYLVPSSCYWKNGLRKVAEKIYDFTRRNRRILAELDEVHMRSIYGVFEYSKDQARIIVNAAQSIIKLIKEIEEIIFKKD